MAFGLCGTGSPAGPELTVSAALVTPCPPVGAPLQQPICLPGKKLQPLQQLLIALRRGEQCADMALGGGIEAGCRFKYDGGTRAMRPIPFPLHMDDVADER